MEFTKVFWNIRIPAFLAFIAVSIANMMSFNPDLELITELVFELARLGMPMYAGYLVVKDGGMDKFSAGVGGVVVYLVALLTHLAIGYLLAPVFFEYLFSSGIKEIFGVVFLVAIIIYVILTFFLGYVGGEYAEKRMKKEK